MDGQSCAHTRAIETPKEPTTRQCDERVKIAARWVEPGERWLYCFLDDAFAEY